MNTQEAAREAAAGEAIPPTARRTFGGFEEMVAVLREMASALTTGMGGTE